MKRLGLVCLFFFATNVFSQTLLTKVIQLQYVSADQLIHLIQPMMQSGETITGSGQTLVAKASPETLTQIRSLVHQLDIPPVTFNVSVYQGNPQWLSTQNDNTVSNSTRTQSQMLQSQSVRVMSGDSALVAMDQEVPIVSSVGAGFFTGIAYQQHQIKNGILVRPVLRGSQVQLSVHRLREQMNPAGGQQFDNQKIDTTLMVPLNKWVSLGNPEGSQQTDNSSTYNTAGNTFANQSTLYVKVSIIGGGTQTNTASTEDGRNGW